MLTLRLALRALRWRAGASITVFAVALVSVLAATVGPIYLHAIDEDVLTARLHEAPIAQRNVHLTRDTIAAIPDVDWTAPVITLADDAAQTRWYGTPIVEAQGAITMTAQGTLYASRLAGLDGACDHLRFVSGGCPARTDQAAISARTAASGKWRVGDKIMVIPGDSTSGAFTLTIAGVYQPIDPSGAYWSIWNLFDAGGTLVDSQLPRLDSLIVQRTALSARYRILSQNVAADVPLEVGTIGIDDVGTVRRELRALQTAAATLTRDNGTSRPTLTTPLLAVLDGMQKELDLSRSLVIVATTQLTLLALCVLYLLIAASTQTHAPEVALAKLRGRRASAVVAQGVLEPAVLVVVAAPIGALLAWVAIRQVGSHTFDAHTPVAFPPSAWLVAAGTTVAALLAAVIAARRTVAAPVGTLLRRSEDAARRRVGASIADAVAVVLAIAGLVELSSKGILASGSADPVAVIAPTLIAVAAAIVGLRAVPLVGRWFVRGTRESRRLVPYLAVRNIVRRPSGARPMVVVAIAVALAVFAVANWTVADRNRTNRALNEAGAWKVLTVSPPQDGSLIDAVDRADPRGHSMAAVVSRIGATTPVLAVDSSRMAGVMAWRPHNTKVSLATVRSIIAPPLAQPIVLTGTRVRVSLDSTQTPVSFDLTGTYADDRHNSGTFVVHVHRGVASYRAELASSCVRGCRLSLLSINPDTSTLLQNSNMTLAVTGLDTATRTSGWRPVPRALQTASWAPIISPGENIRADSRGFVLTDSLSPQLPVQIMLEATDLPDPVPVVFATETSSVYPGEQAKTANVQNLDGNTINVDGSLAAITLPQLDRTGAMADLRLLERAMLGQALNSATFQVWLARNAPRDMVQRLAAQGFSVLSTDTAAAHRTALDRTGPAFVTKLFAVGAAVAALLAVGVAVLAGTVGARRRSYEVAALHAIGVPKGTLRRASAVEQGLLLAIGLVLGVAAGVSGSVVALRSTPFFVNEKIGPTVEHAIPVRPIVVLVVAFVLVLGAACVLVTALVTRQATATRLREAQQ